MVTFAHTAPDCTEIMWNEENWTLVSMPISSTRTEWDEGLRTVRQFNDLLRVLPPLPQKAAQPELPARHSAAPSRPLAPAGRVESPPRHPQPDAAAMRPDTVRREPQGGEPAHREPGESAHPEPGGEPAHRDNSRSRTVRRSPPPGRNGHQATHYQR
jgi:hypothetical protein